MTEINIQRLLDALVEPSMTTVYDRGALVLVEVAFKRKVANVNSYTYSDVTTPTVYLTDVNSIMVYSAVMSKTNAGSAGLYNYIVPTSTGWAKGLYETKVTALDNALNDLFLTGRAFELK